MLALEIVHYDARDETKVTPVLDLSAQWSPWVGTTFSLSAFRKIWASPVEVGQVFTATGVQGGISQTIFQRFVASVYVGYENDDYSASGSNVPSSRSNR